MSNLYKQATTYLSILSIALLMVSISGTLEESEASLTASTSLTIVNVAGRTYGGRSTSIDVTQWSQEKATGIKTGNWPSIPGLVPYTNGFSSPSSAKDIKLPTGLVAPGQLWYEVYLYDAHVSGHGQTWSTIPSSTPWAGFPEAAGLNSMIANVYSIDNGKNFWVHSWDYLAPGTSSKGGEGSWDDCWLGTMVHSFCDFSAGDCNGRYRTNLYFSSYNDDPSCWGAQIMK